MTDPSRGLGRGDRVGADVIVLATSPEVCSWRRGPRTTEDITRLFAERAQAKDAEGLASLYEDEAVLAYPVGQMTEGRAAIRALYEKMLERAPEFEPEKPLPSVVIGDVALTATVAKDEAVARAQVARR